MPQEFRFCCYCRHVQHDRMLASYLCKKYYADCRLCRIDSTKCGRDGSFYAPIPTCTDCKHYYAGHTGTGYCLKFSGFDLVTGEAPYHTAAYYRKDGCGSEGKAFEKRED